MFSPVYHVPVTFGWHHCYCFFFWHLWLFFIFKVFLAKENQIQFKKCTPNCSLNFLLTSCFPISFCLSKSLSYSAKALMLCAELTYKAFLSRQSPNLWSSLKNNFQSALFSKLWNIWYAVLPRPSSSPPKESLRASILLVIALSVGSLTVEFGSIVKVKSNIAYLMLWRCLHTLITSRVWQLPSSLDLCKWYQIHSAFFVIILFVWLSLPTDSVSMTQINWQLQNHHFTLWYRLVKNLVIYNKEKNEQISYQGLLKLLFYSPIFPERQAKM